MVPVSSIIHGHCRDNEICVDGLGADRSLSGHLVASCVSTEHFVRMVGYGSNSGNKTGLRTSLVGGKANMMISEPDGTTPVEVDTLLIEPVIATDHSGPTPERLTAAHSAQSKCRDCVDLRTEQFEKGTEGLRTQATLLTTGAAAGIMWLALLSG